MERVLGIGGVLFRAKEPERLMRWYEQHLGVACTGSAWLPERGPTVLAALPERTPYFGRMEQGFLLNFRVANLDRMAAQLREAGVVVTCGEPHPVGRFARLHDPEGNPIELWEATIDLGAPEP